jgi:hypothetical protein
MYCRYYLPCYFLINILTDADKFSNKNSGVAQASS